MAVDEDERGGGAAPCFAGDLVGGHVVDPETARDVARFRKAERARLIAARLAVDAAERTTLARAVAPVLDRLVGTAPDTIVSVYWPFRGELDLRFWMAELHARGVQVGMPVVVERARPLIFRAWTPDARMARGVWNIPIPADGAPVVPNVIIAPLVGVDGACFRLGYGGGFYDRTLAALPERRLVIGIGHPVAAVPTIYPQPFDVPMDVVVLGPDGVVRRGATA